MTGSYYTPKNKNKNKEKSRENIFINEVSTTQ